MFAARRVFQRVQKATTNFTATRKFNTENVWARENVPFYGALVGVTALCFQISVLYPWHHELSTQFTEIQKLILQLQVLSKDLDMKINRIMIIEEEVKIKERKILDREEEILQTETKVLKLVSKLARASDLRMIDGISNRGSLAAAELHADEDSSDAE